MESIINLIIPKDIMNMSVMDLIVDPNTKMTKKANYIELSLLKDNKLINLNISYPDADFTNLSRVERDDLIMKLLSEGKTQKEVADIAGIKQTTVSKIKKGRLE